MYIYIPIYARAVFRYVYSKNADAPRDLAYNARDRAGKNLKLKSMHVPASR